MTSLSQKTLLSIFVLLAVASWAAPAAAQERNGRITGTIYDDMGMPMAGQINQTNKANTAIKSRLAGIPVLKNSPVVNILEL